MTADEIIRDLPKGLLYWYDFSKSGKVLCISDEAVLADYLREQKLQVSYSSVKEFLDTKQITAEEYDFIIAVQLIEYASDPVSVLEKLQAMLKPEGRLLLGVDNRLGLRYFCGDIDPFTERNFDGIEHYRRVTQADRGELVGRNYPRAEVEQFLTQAGIENHKFYAVLPDLTMPQLIYADGFPPVEELGIRYFPMYHNPDTVFLEEEYLYTDLVQNGLFQRMANAFLIECSKDGTFSNINHVTLAMDRGRENSVMTKIRNDGWVEKRAIYEEGKCKASILMENAADLQAYGLKVVEATVQNDVYVIPYIEAESAVTYFQNLILQDKEKFIQEVDRFRKLILQSSEQIEPVESEFSQYIKKQSSSTQAQVKEELGVWLKKGYPDLVPLNCFVIDGEFVFYDQEFYEENYPANAIILREISIIYSNRAQMEAILPMDFFYERYGLNEQLELWYKYAGEFTTKLRHQRELRLFNEKYMRNYGTVNSNRQRMNYSAGDYQRLFIDIFRNVENKKLILFGSGNFAKKFLALYGKDYAVDCILDNNADKWGQELEGIRIDSPDILKQMQPGEYKVIICIKNYVAVVKQLKQLGVKYYGIYDTDIEYPTKRLSSQELSKENTTSQVSVSKKYHVGYIAGVFDLFHVGHLNMFRRAKEQCEYLIVGVVTDEGVRKGKNTEPFIPFNERIEMVRSCKYVDEAVEIPQNYGGTRDAYRLYHFDAQFSGSDYVDNPNWLAEKQFLEKNGAELVFFPYTESTSSTKIKAMIEKRML